MSQTRANLLMLIASFIWGTAFVSQTTGMGTIGPFTFSFSRFFFATIAVLPIALYFEANNFLKIFFNSKLLKLSIATAFFLIRPLILSSLRSLTDTTSASVLSAQSETKCDLPLERGPISPSFLDGQSLQLSRIDKVPRFEDDIKKSSLLKETLLGRLNIN